MADRIVRGYGIHDRLKEAGSSEPKPSFLVAVDGDGGEVKINITEARNKWARVMLALREVAWVRCDVFDKKGGLVFRHSRCADDRDAPAGELEELPPTRAVAELTGMVNIMLRAQEMVLIRHHQTVAAKDDALMKLVELSLKRFETQEEQLQAAMQLNHQLSADLVNAQLGQLQLAAAPTPVDADGNPKPRSDSAIDAMMPMIVRSMMQPSPKAAPTNGTHAAPKNGAKNGVKKADPQERRESSPTPASE